MVIIFHFILLKKQFGYLLIFQGLNSKSIKLLNFQLLPNLILRITHSLASSLILLKKHFPLINHEFNFLIGHLSLFNH